MPDGPRDAQWAEEERLYLHHLRLQMADGYPEVPSAWDAGLGVRPDEAAFDWLQKHFAPGSDLAPDLVLACWDAGAERSAYLAPAFRRAKERSDEARWATVVVPHTLGEVRFAERSFSVAAARPDACLPLALRVREPRSRLARQLR